MIDIDTWVHEYRRKRRRYSVLRAVGYPTAVLLGAWFLALLWVSHETASEARIGTVSVRELSERWARSGSATSGTSVGDETQGRRDSNRRR
jgi:hypothetical protein